MDASIHPDRDPRVGPAKPVRVLVAFEDVRGLYRETIGRALRRLRPALRVRSASLAGLGREIERFDPHVVVCSLTNDGHPGGRGAWVQVPTDDGAAADARRARVCLEGESWETDGPTLGEILDVIDEARRRMSEGGLAEGC